MGEAVVRADDERGERVARIEDRRDRRLVGAALGRRSDRGHRGAGGLARLVLAWIRGTLTAAGGRSRAAGDRDEAHVDGPADQSLERRAHLAAVLVVEPLAGERVRDADAEDVVLFAHDVGLFEPRVVVRLRHRELQLTEGSTP